ncbi:MAG TPA: 50S ribosomal protein L24 [Bacteroidia bacterium]|nr:50S ribosomal protein L24 [Bacteroidia bacterium]
MAKLKIKKGDSVVIISGEHKDRDTRYKVVAVNPKDNRVFLEGLTVKKHTRPTTKHPNGGIVDVPASVHISNLMMVGPDGQPTRVGRRLNEETGKLERYSKKSEEVIK